MGLNGVGLGVWEGFDKTAGERPDQPAVVEVDGTLTFSELRAGAEGLAALMVATLGEGSHHVGIRTKSARALVMASLAAARAGMVSVSLDLRDPGQRMAAVCKDADVALVVTDGPDAPPGTPELVVKPGEVPGGRLERPPGTGPDDLSCITYSSGSTGDPKGIMWTHRARMGIASGMQELTTARRAGVIFAGTSTNSDVFALLAVTGQALVAYPVGEDGLGRLAAWSRENEIDGIGLVPTVVRHLLATVQPGDKLSARHVTLYGEAPMWSDIARLRELLPPDAVIVNTYGAMETAGGTLYRIEPTTPIGEGRVPAGWANPRRTVEVLAPDGSPLPPGEVGEIAISGADLPVGYWAKPELTAQKWRRLPDGRRQLWTGDLGYMGEDGCLHVVGRNDHMVKVNGFKVELTGIEQRMLSVPGVSAAAAVPREDHEGNIRVLAWAVAGGGHSERSLRAELKRLLPGPMVPDRVLLVDELPRLGNGKVDRQELARRDIPPPKADAGDGLCEEVAKMFARILDVPGVRPGDDFFDLGGDSLRAARLVAELERTYGVSLGGAIMLEQRTPASLAAILAVRINSPSGQRGTSRVIPVRVTGTRPPLIVVHDGYGGVMYARGLAQLLGEDQPVYAIEGEQADGRPAVDRTVETLAARYIADMQRALPHGPYMLYGYSFGGMVAYEMAQQLAATGGRVTVVAVGDTPAGEIPKWSPPPVAARFGHIVKVLPSYGLRAGAKRAADVYRGFAERKRLEREVGVARRYLESGDVAPPMVRGRMAMLDNAAIAANYKLRPYDGDVLLFTCTSGDHSDPKAWERYVRGNLEVIEVGTAHTELMGPGGIELVAAGLAKYAAAPAELQST
jgi:enterobactin synthetase component F